MLRLVPSILLIVLSLSPLLHAQRLTLYTEEFPPFNYTDQGKHTGAATEVVQALMQLTNQSYVIKSYPWARSFHNSQFEKNALIYSISRRENREHLFKWIGVIVPANQSVYALKQRSDIQINSIEDMKAYKIGTTIEDARESYLVSQGFDSQTFERFGGNNAYSQLFLQLKRGRIDLWPMPNAVMNYVVRANNEEPENVIRHVYSLSEISQEGYYIAASLSTPDDVVKQLQQALTQFKLSQTYEDIIKKWGL